MSRMSEVAAMFGKKLNVSFMVRGLYGGDKYKCLFSDRGLEEFNYRDAKWYLNTALLTSLLAGEAVIME